MFNIFLNAPQWLITALFPQIQTFQTENKLSSFAFSLGNVIKVIKVLDPNKARGHDQISIHLTKLCVSSILKPSHIIFKYALENECFLEEWKKANVDLVHKKCNKELINNYRPVLPLPICAKVFEKFIFNFYFKYFDTNSLIKNNRCGFRPADSCAPQLLLIKNDILQTYDTFPLLELRSVFFDLSKIF